MFNKLLIIWLVGFIAILVTMLWLDNWQPIEGAEWLHLVAWSAAWPVMAVIVLVLIAVMA
jgi:hypothetical protein